MNGDDVVTTRGAARQPFLLLACISAIAISFCAAVPLADAKEPVFDFCVSGEIGGQCSSPRGVAINQDGTGGVAAGTVYVSDFQNRRIQVFDADGNFLLAWGADVVAGGTTGFEICVAAATCKRGAESGIAGGFFGNAGGIAVHQGTGDVYVVDRNNFRVQQFTATGSFVRAWGGDVDSTGGTGFEICEVAANCKAGIEGTGAGFFGSSGALAGIGTDAAGGVYVADAGNSRVQKFASNGTFLRMGGWDVNAATGSTKYEICATAASCKAGIAGAGNACQFQDQNPNHLAVASSGDVYAVDTGNGRIYRLASTLACDSAFALPATLGADLFRAIAVDPGSGRLLITEDGSQTIYEVDPAVGEVVEESVSGASAFWVGLAVNGATGRVYGASSSPLSGGSWMRVLGFGALPSVVTSPAVTAITGTSATVKGWVNPVGVPLTECAFEYVESINFESTGFAGAEKEPCAETLAEIGSGTDPVSVHAELTGLSNGTKYHFRLVAANGSGQAQALPRSFETAGPQVIETWSQDVTLAEADLRAEIDPKGSATTYRFEYGTSSAYGQQTPELPVGPDTGVQEVSFFLEGLQPGTTYHYRVVATNADGVREGPDRVFTTYVAPTLEVDCPNQGFRAGASERLPDCRAYELVSPPDKGGGDIIAAHSFDLGREAAWRQSAPDGDRVTYTSTTAFGDALRGTIANQYLSSRDPTTGWSTHGINPPQETTVFDPAGNLSYDLGINFLAFRPDLCEALLRDHNVVPLAPEGLEGHTNLYVRDNCPPGTDSYEALTTALFGTVGDDLTLNYASFSADGRQVVFGATAALTPNAKTIGNQRIYAYDRATRQLRLVSVLPLSEGGKAAIGDAAVGTAYASISHGRESPLARAISTDGSRIFWTSAGKIYVNIADEGTRLVSVGGSFVTAATDGSIAIVLKAGELLEFDVDAGTTTPIAGDVGGVAAASEDLSHLYFTSDEDLADGATAGGNNLYLRRGGGGLEFVAALSPEDGVAAGLGIHVDSTEPFLHGSRTTPDGRYLAFMSNRSLTGYDNVDVAADEPASEVFRYDAVTDTLTCVSCKPSGARPAGRPLDPLYGRTGTPPHVRAAAWIPTWEWANHGKRVLSDDGRRIYFNSYDALGLQDTNGAQDVYQWEALGAGGCSVDDSDYAAANGGCVSLISDGRDAQESELLDASTTGRDVFFTTASSLDPRDPGSIDVYDAREGGGFPPPPPPVGPCVGDACQPVPSAPVQETPASAVFRGPGDSVKGIDCRPKARRAAKLSRQAKFARHAAARAETAQAERQLLRRAARLSGKARRWRQAAKKCRRSNRGAKR